MESRVEAIESDERELWKKALVQEHVTTEVASTSSIPYKAAKKRTIRHFQAKDVAEAGAGAAPAGAVAELSSSPCMLAFQH